MYAQNAFNQSQKTDTATATTQQSVFKEAQVSANAITGAIAGVVVVLLIACVITISILESKREKVSLYITWSTVSLINFLYDFCLHGRASRLAFRVFVYSMTTVSSQGRKTNNTLSSSSMSLESAVNDIDEIKVRSTSYLDSHEDIVVVNFTITKSYMPASPA